MRKSLICLVVLLVLSVTVLAAGHTNTTGQQTAVRITESTVLGDAAAAEGLELQVTANYERYLYWDTTYAAAADPTYETEFAFYPGRRDREQSYAEILDFQTASLNYGMGGNDIDLEGYESNEDMRHEAMMVKPAIDLASRTEAWETKTEVFRLRDYYDNFKMRGEIRLRDVYIWDDEWVESFTDYFRIPVPDDLMVQVTVMKNAMGQICDVDLCDVDKTSSYYAYASSVLVDDHFYFVMVTDEENGLDLSGLPEYGIWKLPVIRNEDNGRTTVTCGDLQLAMSLDREQVTARRLTASADGSKLHLITKENGLQYLYILDVQTMTQLQRISLSCEELPTIWEVENLLILQYTHWDQEVRQEMMQVLESGKDGYEFWPEMQLYPYMEGYWMAEPSLAYDGQRLAIAVLHDEWLTGSARLSVYTKEGAVYVGDYYHSGDDIARDLGVNDEHRLQVHWKQEG